MVKRTLQGEGVAVAEGVEYPIVRPRLLPRAWICIDSDMFPDQDTLVSRLLTMSALSLAVLSAIGGFLFAAHSLAAPTNAPLSAFTCGIVTFLTVRFGLGLGEDA